MTVRVVMFITMFILCAVTPGLTAEQAAEEANGPFTNAQEAMQGPSTEEQLATLEKERPEGIAAANSYLSDVGLEESFDQIYGPIAQQIPGEQAKKIVDTMKSHVRMDEVRNIVKLVLLHHYTDEELKALADFYGSDVGKSISEKLPVYLEDVNAAIQGEAQRALMLSLQQIQLEAAKQNADKAPAEGEAPEASAPEASEKDQAAPSPDAAQAPEKEEKSQGTWGKKPEKKD